MSNDTELDFLKQIFEQVEIQPTVEFEFRLYHDETGEPVCFSYEQLDMPYIVVEKSFYDAHILTGYKIIPTLLKNYCVLCQMVIHCMLTSMICRYP